MTRFFTNENLAAIPKQQFPYQSQHSCEDTLVLAINWWQRAVDDDKYCGLVLADMSTAFGRVRHQALGATLSSIGIRGMALKWFISYLSNGQQQATTAEGLSFPSPCTRAVPQGSVRGPLLFSLYIRDAPDVLSTDSQLFADDIAFYTANPSLSHIVSNNVLSRSLFPQQRSRQARSVPLQERAASKPQQNQIYGTAQTLPSAFTDV